MLSLPSTFPYVSVSSVFFQDPSFFTNFINVMVPHSFILHLLAVCTFLLFNVISSHSCSYHWCTHLYHPIIPVFELHTQISTGHLSLNDRRHIRLNVQNITHIPPQIYVFFIKAVPLLSIKWPSQKLETILDSFISHMPPNSIDFFLISQHCCFLFIIITIVFKLSSFLT